MVSVPDHMRFLCKTKMWNYLILINGLRKLTFLMSFETMLKISTENLGYFFNYFGFKPPDEYYSHLDQEEIKIKLKETQTAMKKSFVKFARIKTEFLEAHEQIDKDKVMTELDKNGKLIDLIYEKVKASLHLILLGLF